MSLFICVQCLSLGAMGWSVNVAFPGHEVIKPFHVNSAEHEIYPAHKI